jgi:hypothetical protein
LQRAEEVVKEFDIAVRKGLSVIPVGATGHVAEDLWNRVRNDFNIYCPGASVEFRKLFDAIGPSDDPNPKELTEAILAIIGHIRRGKV